MCCVRGPEAEIQTGGTNVPCTGPEAEIQTGGTNVPCTGTRS